MLLSGTLLIAEPVYAQMSQADAEGHIRGISGAVDKTRLKRVLVADKEVLASYIRGEDTVFSRLAMREAGRRKDASLASVLVERVYDRRDAMLSASAAGTLGILSGDTAPIGLNKALRDTRAEVRIAAGLVLGRYKVHASIPVLREALQRRDTGTRLAAANLLAQMDDKQSAPRVGQLVDAADPATRREFCKALARFGDAASWRKLETMLVNESYSGTRAHAAFALEKRGKPAVPALIRALKDRSGQVRYAAARSLEAIGDTSALAALQQASRENAPDAKNAGYMNTQARNAAQRAFSTLQQKMDS